MAGAVILSPDLDPSEPWLKGINDSKKLTPLQRERAAEEVHRRAVAVGIGLSDPQEIDSLGISKATILALQRAVQSLAIRPHHLLIDYVALPDSGFPNSAVKGGDGRCYSIAAASIVAKVARDRLMVEANDIYTDYGFHLHKGYGTQHHIHQLNRIGPCSFHRFSFSPVRRAQFSLQEA
jgi:ribonuclease HII